MTPEIGLALGILFTALILLVTEWLRADVLSMLVLAAVALTGLVGPGEALSGFSNPAVVTVWAMFMLSAGLTRTGVANLVGRQVLRVVGCGEARIVAVIMLVAAALSAFMNNIGVTALLLPMVMDVARKSGRSPSRLLMPLAFGSLLGGLTTLIGTPSNLLVSQLLADGGEPAFRLFDFSPVGLVASLAGIAFVALLGRHRLPALDVALRPERPEQQGLQRQYGLHERTVVMRMRPDSPLAGKSLRESRLGSAAGLNVIAVIRDGSALPAPGPEFQLRTGDRLLVGGRLDRFEELKGWRDLVVERPGIGAEELVSGEIVLCELRLPPGSALVGRSLGQADFRKAFGVIVLAFRRGSTVTQDNLVDETLEADDRLLVQGNRSQIESLWKTADFERLASSSEELARSYRLEQSIFTVRVPADSVLRFKSLAKSRLGEALGLAVLGVIRRGRTELMPRAEERLLADDRLIVRGKPEDLELFHGLQQLDIESEAPRDVQSLESAQIGLVEAALSSRTTAAGATLRQLHFRERCGLQVLAVLREGRAYRSKLRDMRLRFGDALLLFGRRERILMFARDPEFIVLTQAAHEVPRARRAPVAASVMFAMLAAVALGWVPVSIAAVSGAGLMIATGCLGIEDAYRAVEWRSIFLIAGMLPLGIALKETGAAGLLVEPLLSATGFLGPWGVILVLYLVTAVAAMLIPAVALVALLAPVVLEVSAGLGVSSQTGMMAVAIAASASFASPVCHPANTLVMGPGGYTAADYRRRGLPLTLVVAAVAAVLLPLLWPLQPR